jgi:hypothetical protein
MNRRAFITLLGGAAAASSSTWHLASECSQSRAEAIEGIADSGRVRLSDMDDRSGKSDDPSPCRRLWPRSDWHVSTMFGRTLPFRPAQAYAWPKI